MSIPISSSLNELNANVFFREGFELSLDAIVPSVELTGSFTQFESKTQFFGKTGVSGVTSNAPANCRSIQYQTPSD